MSSTDTNVGEPGPIDKEYVDIIKSDTDIDKKFLQDQGLPSKIIYYCLDCKKLTTPKRFGKKFKFSCEECKGSKVAFGSEASIAKYYKIPESKLKK